MAKAIEGQKDDALEVVDCSTFETVAITESQFFEGYMAEDHQGCNMLKLKDWPPERDFAVALKPHFKDFVKMLPVPAYTSPVLGAAPLNLAAALDTTDNPTDLGPKIYIGYGRQQEATDGQEGDCVTKLHLDMTHAVNVCVHARYKEGERPRVRCGDADADAPG